MKAKLTKLTMTMKIIWMIMVSNFPKHPRVKRAAVVKVRMTRMIKNSRKAKMTTTLEDEKKGNALFHPVAARLFIFLDTLEMSTSGAKCMRGRQYQDWVCARSISFRMKKRLWLEIEKSKRTPLKENVKGNLAARRKFVPSKAA